MFIANPDGAGLSWVQDNMVYVVKGIFDEGELWKRYTQAHAISDVVLHCRISTCCGVDKTHTHPFPMTKKRGNLFATTYTTKMSVAHNGTIRVDMCEGMSDTQSYIWTHLMPIYNADPDFLHDKETLKQIDKEIGWSKLAFQTPTEIVYVGDWKKLRDGVMCSNLSWQYYFDDSYIYDTYYSFNDYASYEYDYRTKRSKRKNKRNNNWNYNSYYYQCDDGSLIAFDTYQEYYDYKKEQERKKIEDAQYEMWWTQVQQEKASKRAKYFFNN